VLHPAGSIGLVTVARRINGRWREQRFPAEALPDVVALCARTPDAYLSQNRFRGPRQIVHLLALDALYVDLDYQYVDDYAQWRPEGILDLVYETLADSRIPAPSYAVATGRGLALVWLHEPVPRGALPRWRACQRKLYQVLTPLGADRAALDPARVLRVVGSENPKAERVVRALTPVGHIWTFDGLADEILPITRATLHDLRIQRALRAAETASERKTRPPQGFTAATLWEARLSDLQRLRELRTWGQLPPGHRDSWLFLAGVAMSWLAEPFLLRRELLSLARQVGGWDDREAVSRMQAIFKRARMAREGQTIEWQGVPIDPRYHFRTETILEWLTITEEEQRQLTTLIGENEAKHRDRQRHRKHTDRATYLAQAEQRRLEALQRRAQGQSLRQIARALDVTEGAVRYMLRSRDS
jgi:hypothetical protein